MENRSSYVMWLVIVGLLLFFGFVAVVTLLFGSLHGHGIWPYLIGIIFYTTFSVIKEWLKEKYHIDQDEEEEG